MMLVLLKEASLISKKSGVLSQLAQNATEFNFDIGTRVYNYGQNDQANMTVNATLMDLLEVFTMRLVTLPTVPSGDSVDV